MILVANSPGGPTGDTGAGDGDWKTVHRNDDAEGVTTPDKPGQGLRKDQLKIVFNPVAVHQDSGVANSLPQGTHRKEVRQDNYGGRPIKVKLPYDKYPDEGTREYYYAPGQGSLTQSSDHVQAASSAAPALVPPNMNSDAPSTPDTYHEDQLNYAPGSDGFKDLEQDSNFSMKPKTWRFRHHDKDLSLTPMPNQTGLPEPEHSDDQGLEDIIWPLAASLDAPQILFIRAGYGDVGRGYRFSKPKLVGTYSGGNEALVQSTVSWHGKPAHAEGDYFDIRFWMAIDKTHKNKAALSQNLPVEVYEAPAGDEVMPAGGPISQEDNAQARWLAGHIPMEVLQDAAEAMGLEYKAEEAAAKEVRDARVERKEAEAETQHEKTETAKKRAEEEKAKQEVIEKRTERKKAEKVGTGKGKPYNILQDPVLARVTPDMPDVEKTFTTIRDWDGDEYATTLDKLDAGTKALVESNPSGEGKYFSWDVVTEEEAQKLSQEQIEKTGRDSSGELAGKGLLNVTRLPGWKNVEEEVQKGRKELRLT